MKTLLIIGGFFWLSLAVFHLLFWKLFEWKDELTKLSSVNKAIMQVMNLSLTFLFLIFGYVSIVHSNELLTTDIGKALLIGIVAFGIFRAIQQIVFFTLENHLSKCFFVFILVGTVCYLIPLFG